MIEIKTLDGESLDLFPSTKITFIRKNPFFLEEVVTISSRSQNFDIPVTPKNEKLLKRFNRLNSFIRSTDVLEVDVLVGGRLFLKAALNVFRSPADTFSVSLTRRYVRFRNDAQLRELDLGTIENGSEVEIRNFNFGKFWPEIPYCFPQWYNKQEGTIAIEPEQQNNEDSDLRPVNWNGGFNQTALDQDTAVPMFYLPWAVREIVKAAGTIHAKGKFLIDPIVQDKVIFNTTSTNDRRTLSKLFVSLNSTPTEPGKNNIGAVRIQHIEDRSRSSSDKSELKSIDWFEFSPGTQINFEIYEMIPTGGVQNVYSVNYTTVLADVGDPTTLIGNITSHIAAMAVPNLVIDNRPQNNNSNATQLLRIWFSNGNNINLLGNEYSDWDYYGPNSAQIVFSDSFDYADILPQMHLPDITVGEFLNSIARFYNLSVFLEDNSDTLLFEWKNDTLSKEKIDVSQYMLADYEKEAKEKLNLWVDFVQDRDDKEAANLRLHANNYPEHTYTPQTKIQVNCATLGPNQSKLNAIERFPIVNAGYATMPVTEMQIGTYEDPASFSLRLLKVEGVQEDDKGNPYIACSNFDLTPNEIFGYHWAEWYQVMKHAGRYFWINFDFPLDFLLNFDKTKCWQILENGVVWEEMRVTIGMEKIEQTQVKLLKL